ncbi:MarR family winged helix-turn-helix transcriptional regulator [Patulibacter minatonensis]|uniref:MarR family winged helix-turn-helix transcriptional regulator n=1 Tax=Patulibacter minatonensis TaxID=298163 RepID=UPI0004798968|nr:MarR family transcriptional regulator [Patulibacter minatonensis]
MPSDEDLGPQLSGRLGYLLKRAHLGLAELHEEVLAPFGVSDRELAILLLLDGREPESQQQLAHRLGVDRTTMVALIDALERKELVARRPDPADRRRNVIALTDAGQQTRRDATRASDEAERRLLHDLDDAEADRFRALLRRVARPRRD